MPSMVESILCNGGHLILHGQEEGFSRVPAMDGHTDRVGRCFAGARSRGSCAKSRTQVFSIPLQLRSFPFLWLHIVVLWKYSVENCFTFDLESVYCVLESRMKGTPSVLLGDFSKKGHASRPLHPGLRFNAYHFWEFLIIFN